MAVERVCVKVEFFLDITFFNASMAKQRLVFKKCNYNSFIFGQNKEKLLRNVSKQLQWAVVVAQLERRLLPTQEVRGSNPVIGKLLYPIFKCLPTANKCIEKRK